MPCLLLRLLQVYLTGGPAVASGIHPCICPEATRSLGCSQLERSRDMKVRAHSRESWDSSSGQFWFKDFPPYQTFLARCCSLRCPIQSSLIPSLLLSFAPSDLCDSLMMPTQPLPHFPHSCLPSKSLALGIFWEDGD